MHLINESGLINEGFLKKMVKGLSDYNKKKINAIPSKKSHLAKPKQEPYKDDIIDSSEAEKFKLYTKKLFLNMYKDIISTKKLSPYIVKNHREVIKNFIDKIEFIDSTKYEGYKEIKIVSGDIIDFSLNLNAISNELYDTDADYWDDIDGGELGDWLDDLILNNLVKKYKLNTNTGSYTRIEDSKYPQLAIVTLEDMVSWAFSVSVYFKEE